MPKINKYIDEELAAAESVSGTDKLLITQSGTPKAATISQVAGTVDVTTKADKVATSPAPTDYLAKFDASGNLAVSTKQESDIGDDSTKADKIATSPDPTDHVAAFDATGNLKDSTKTITQLAGVISAQHTHNTDTMLDEGNENQVTALEIVTLRDTTVPAKADKILSYIDCSASITSPTLTAAQVSGTVLTNFGQGAENVQIKLPAAAAGYSFVAVMATAPSGNTWKITADTNDKIYLDGVAGSDGESAIVTPSIGNFITFFSFQTGESPDTYDWIAQTGQGTWTAGA